MTTEKACKNCHLIVTGDICPICKTSELTANWKGFTLILNPEKSKIAEKFGIKVPGKYALRVSK